MQCYPSVLIIDKTINIFYNGNGFGKSGIGLAKITGLDKLWNLKKRDGNVKSMNLN